MTNKLFLRFLNWCSKLVFLAQYLKLKLQHICMQSIDLSNATKLKIAAGKALVKKTIYLAEAFADQDT